MTNPEKAPDPADIQIQMDSEDGETIEVTDVVSDTTVRPAPESVRKALSKYLQAPYTGGPQPPPENMVEDMVIDESNSVEDNTVRPAPESIRKHLSKYLQPPYTGQRLPPEQSQEPPKDNPPA